MTYLTKSFMHNYITSKLVDINETIEQELYYVAGFECRELIGIIHFLWVVEYLKDEEREAYNSQAYALKSICENKTNKCF